MTYGGVLNYELVAVQQADGSTVYRPRVEVATLPAELTELLLQQVAIQAAILQTLSEAHGVVVDPEQALKETIQWT